MSSLPLILLTVGLLSGGPAPVSDLAPGAPDLMISEALSTPLETEASGFSLFEPIGPGVPVFVPTTNLAVCDGDEPNPCPPGCFCLIIRGVVSCFC